MKKRDLGFLLLAVFSAMMLLAACSTSDDTETGGDADQETAVEQEASDTAEAGETAEVAKGTVMATVIVFGSDPPAPLAGAKVTALDNKTAQPIAGVAEQTTDAAGKVTFTGLKGDADGLVAFKITMDKAKDTYHFNIKDTSGTEIFYSVEEALIGLVAGLSGLKLDAAKGVAAGAVYWVGATANEPIGCATVATDPAGGEARYFGEKLPTTIDKQANTNKLNGRYVIANIPPGETALKATLNGSEIGKTRLFATANAICISSIYVKVDANPGCK